MSAPAVINEDNIAPIVRFCDVRRSPAPVVASDPTGSRVAAIQRFKTRWNVGETIRYAYIPGEGDATQIDIVEKAWANWQKVCPGLTFENVSLKGGLAKADVKIGFRQDGTSWSYVGVDCTNRTILEQSGEPNRTMNFGWPLQNQPETAEHEIGHALGLDHEHQNPKAGIVWNIPAVYDWALRTQRWSKTTTDHNILTKLTLDQMLDVASPWDRDSIMHYSFEKGLIVDPADLRNGLVPKSAHQTYANGVLTSGLSRQDKEIIAKVYPAPRAPSDASVPSTPSEWQQPGDAREPYRGAYRPPVVHDSRPKLVPYVGVPFSDLLDGEQIDLTLHADRTCVYHIQTLGYADVRLALFRDLGAGHSVFLKGNDTAGTDQDSEIVFHLTEGENYIVRALLYTYYGSVNKFAVIAYYE
eukprot:TRINITY_DN2469_c0_g1_i1.p1 TRINITY_DN2469_c0_g1~~TRINITY_DN2469_c0_g1_i1.p1  ORF type:complete len:413 (-),score=71.34 TRINITY_DN2469_c0_g1_i1:38-1276(-)